MTVDFVRGMMDGSTDMIVVVVRATTRAPSARLRLRIAILPLRLTGVVCTQSTNRLVANVPRLAPCMRAVVWCGVLCWLWTRAQAHPVPNAVRDELIVPSLDTSVENPVLAVDFFVDADGALGALGPLVPVAEGCE